LCHWLVPYVATVLHDKWLAERAAEGARTTILLQQNLSVTDRPSAFQLQKTMLKSDKIWCTYLAFICVSLRTFWTPFVYSGPTFTQKLTDSQLNLPHGTR